MLSNKNYETLEEFKLKVDKIKIENPPKINTKKNRIPSIIKQHVWDENIGLVNGMSNCFCCRTNIIYQINFHCGHIISEKNGGLITKDNLRPVCSKCNLCMQSKSMYDFIKDHDLWNTNTNINKINSVKTESIDTDSDTESTYDDANSKETSIDNENNTKEEIIKEEIITINKEGIITINKKETINEDTIKEDTIKEDTIKEDTIKEDTINEESIIKKEELLNKITIEMIEANINSFKPQTVENLKSLCSKKNIDTKKCLVKLDFINQLVYKPLTVEDLKHLCNLRNLKYKSAFVKSDYIDLLTKN